MDTYRIEKILDVEKTKDLYRVSTVSQRMQGVHENPAEHGETEIGICLSKGFRVYKVRGKKREKIRLADQARFIKWLRSRSEEFDAEFATMA